MIRVKVPITILFTVTTLAARFSALHIDEIVGGMIVASAGVVANYGKKLGYLAYYALTDSITRFGASVASAAALQGVLGLSEEYLDYNAEMTAGDVLLTLITYESVPGKRPQRGGVRAGLDDGREYAPLDTGHWKVSSRRLPSRSDRWIKLLALSGIALNLIETVDALGDEMAILVDEVVFRFDPAWPAFQACGCTVPIILGALYDALGTSLGFAVLLHPNKVSKILLEPGAPVRALVGEVGRIGLSLLRTFSWDMECSIPL